MKKWIVTAVDTSDSSDGKARVLKVCGSKNEAITFVRDDMETFKNNASGIHLVINYDKMSIHTEDYRYGCEWNLEEVEID